MSGFPVPPALWTPTPKDIAAALVARRRLFSASSAVALASIQVNFNAGGVDVPVDQVFVILSAQVFCSSGAAQTVTRMEFRIGDPNGTVLTSIATREGVDNGAGVVQAVNNLSLPSLWIPIFSDEVPHAACVFNAGAAANTVVLNLTGVYMPRGTWQR